MFVSTKIVKSFFTALTGLAIAGSLIGTASAAVPGNTAVVTGRVTTGALTATIAVKTGLPDVAYSTTSQNTSGTLLLTVDDASATDNGNTGWSVNVQASDFSCSCGFAGNTILASNFSLTTLGTPVATNGQAVDVTNGPLKASLTASSLDSARKVVTTNAKFGNGRYTQELGVQLNVPGYTRPATYTSTVTITYTAAP